MLGASTTLHQTDSYLSYCTLHCKPDTKIRTRFLLSISMLGASTTLHQTDSYLSYCTLHCKPDTKIRTKFLLSISMLGGSTLLFIKQTVIYHTVPYTVNLIQKLEQNFSWVLACLELALLFIKQTAIYHTVHYTVNLIQ
jgi:hypothetical protein